MKADGIYLRHIKDSIDLIEDYLVGTGTALDREFFEREQRTQDAVVRRLETLSDAASHLTDALKARHTEIPWRQINDFRNVLAHGYADIVIDRVWEVIERDLPALKTVVNDELQRLGL